MALQPVNLETQLARQQSKETSNLLEQVEAILKADTAKELQISKTLQSGGKLSKENHFNFDLLETKNIYHINSIKSICIDYRLRFLDTKYFKNEFPLEAIQKIKYLEKSHNTKLSGFKIIAPAKLFKLENADDPLLFAPIGNGYYYLIHKWGNDLHPLRKLSMLPFKNLENVLISALLLSFLITYIFNYKILNSDTQSAQFIILFLFMFKSVVGVTIFYAFSQGKNVSSANWNSKYYNA
ncbi:hypothetical protein [Aurantibacter aestuarii]|uniref:Uncharacterized protein n=1 Tax=Aurantibacter aestuarii TaxID=1266046 RepID=A0A2T1N4Z0_9FLAO|nr:hypothetical protein [Aurantibacter aestuarii]PSG86357.1 hypothetical protein C7H52_11735 [Aurantibacter aestuarii]